MKRMIALILAAILLSVSCIALADEEKPNGFEVNFDFEQDMCFKGVTSVNAFLAAWPLSKLEYTAYNPRWAIVYQIVNGEKTNSRPIVGFDSITLYGERDEDAELYYYQLDVNAYLRVEGETWESYKDQWLDEHPRANIAWHIYNYVNVGDYKCTEAIICYYQSKL